MSFDVPLAFRLLLSRRPQVVVTEPPPTTGVVVRAICAVRRIPYVYYAADVWSDAAQSTGAPRVLVRGVAALERWALRGARAVVAVSDGVAARLGEMGVDEARTTVVRHGIDTEVFSPDGPVHTEPDGAPYLLYAGTASEWHGADVFVEALARVRAKAPRTRLVFLGQGSAWPAMQETARSLGLTVGRTGDVAFVEAVPPAKTAQWLRGARGALASLKPGIGYDFAVPTKTLAAVACGTPVLFVGPGPARAVVEENGLGVGCDYELDAVSSAMAEWLAAEPAGAEERRRLAVWAQTNVSDVRAGREAAQVVRRAASRSGGAAA